MKVKSAYTRLLVTDIEACFLFYRDVMQFKVTVEDFQSGYAEFEAGDMKLALFRRKEMAEMIGNDQKPSSAECQDKVVVIFSVPNLDEAYHELRHKGIEFTTDPMTNPYYGMKTAYLRDPDGNLIGLYEFLD
ncbi:VOC family protein [Coleofasciculus sp. FACHB-712]|uniref:VOC family protein n=1 Tax=Coleofasciculus sp. FACHB-712 TaxID=2692789 RepID=UPI001689EC1A|nr:VOC family protein [Coleofasciculus sp. FACHB-712]MBD1940834.1 VOC family protein [Coleofasciculus sp. FACHB-712]